MVWPLSFPWLPEGLLDAYFSMIPKSDGDALPWVSGPLCVLPIAYRLWASARLQQLKGWFHSWAPESVFSAIPLVKVL